MNKSHTTNSLNLFLKSLGIFFLYDESNNLVLRKILPGNRNNEICLDKLNSGKYSYKILVENKNYIGEILK